MKVVHFENKTLSDKFASALVKLFRKGFDIVTGYKHVDVQEALKKFEQETGKKDMSLKEMRERGLVMTPEQWLAVSYDNLFLRCYVWASSTRQILYYHTDLTLTFVFEPAALLIPGIYRWSTRQVSFTCKYQY